ncbi:hypothetical protein GCM10023194_57870 [Planotetraspora phitsanulokensis]
MGWVWSNVAVFTGVCSVHGHCSLVEHWLFNREPVAGLLVPPIFPMGVGAWVSGVGSGWAHCWVLRKRAVFEAAACG